MKLFVLAVAFSVVAAFAAAPAPFTPKLNEVERQAEECASFCSFSLCDVGFDGSPIVLPAGFGLTFPPSFSAQPPFICSDSQRVGRILRTREAKVRIRSGRFIRISRLGRSSLMAPFNPNFFQVKDIDMPDLMGVSALTRSKFRSMDQRTALEGRCAYLPIRTFEALRPNGEVARVVSSRDPNNCVSFISTGMTTMIKVVLSWDTAADFDLSLTEPTGDVIDFSNNESPNGGFLFQDVSLGDCDVARGLRDSAEMIEYSGIATPPDGTYTVTASQFGPCSSEQKINWRISVMVGDETIIMERGIAGGDDTDIASFTFTLPLPST